MTINLINDAKDVIHYLGLPPEKEQLIATAVVNYENVGESCCDKIAWGAYRIWNAIKAIFGMSDWQVACRTLKNRLGELPSDTIDLPGITDPDQMVSVLFEEIIRRGNLIKNPPIQ